MKKNDNGNRLIGWISLILAAVICIVAVSACAASKSSSASSKADPSESSDVPSAVTPIEEAAEDAAGDAADIAEAASETADESGEAGTPAAAAEAVTADSSSASEDTGAGKETEIYTAPAADTDGDTIIQSADTATGSGRIRQLPSASQSSTPKSQSSTSSVLTDTTKRPSVYSGPSVMFIEKTPVAEKKVAYKDDSFPSTQEDVQQLLKDLASYWASYNLDAVDYLVRMEKYRYLSQLLTGSADCFYYGDTNAEGVPNGKGIAVYAGNQYYYGDFVNGKRSGKGYWYQIFNRKGEYAKANNGIYLHTYNGEWKNDLPDGQGQEHISLDDQYLTTRIVTNVIGTFTEGYYDGEMKATSLDQDMHFVNWTGYCIKGAWAPIDGNVVVGYNKQNQIPVLRNAENRDDYFWMMQEENGGQGVMGLVGR